MIHGQKLFGDMLDYAGSVSNGEINGDNDTNDRKDVVGRVAVRPFNCECYWPIPFTTTARLSKGPFYEPAEPVPLDPPE